MVPPNNSALGWGGSCRAIGIRPAHAHDGSRRSRRLPALCHSKGPKQHLPARRKFVPNTVPWSTAMSSIPALFPCQQARSVPFWLCIRKALALGPPNRPQMSFHLHFLLIVWYENAGKTDRSSQRKKRPKAAFSSWNFHFVYDFEMPLQKPLLFLFG